MSCQGSVGVFHDGWKPGNLIGSCALPYLDYKCFYFWCFAGIAAQNLLNPTCDGPVALTQMETLLLNFGQLSAPHFATEALFGYKNPPQSSWYHFHPLKPNLQLTVSLIWIKKQIKKKGHLNTSATFTFSMATEEMDLSPSAFTELFCSFIHYCNKDFMRGHSSRSAT